MIEFIYQTLAKIGYVHPLHPPMTHLPVGLIIGAFVFLLVARFADRSNLVQTARHCIILALIAVPPTILLGLMDWQYRFGGTWLFPIIMKLTLAGILVILLVIAVLFGRNGQTIGLRLVTVYALCLLTVIGAGFFGGELVYGKKEAVDEKLQGLAAEGAVVFNQNCSVCHHTDSTKTKVGPGLKGIFKQEKFPLSGRMVSEDNFRKQLITPLEKMPPFGHLTEPQVSALIEYLKTL